MEVLNNLVSFLINRPKYLSSLKKNLINWSRLFPSCVLQQELYSTTLLLKLKAQLLRTSM